MIGKTLLGRASPIGTMIKMRAISGVGRCSLVVALAVLVLASRCQRSGSPVAQSGGAPPSAGGTTTRAWGSADDAANVARACYRGINEPSYRDAYRLWESGGAPTGQRPGGFRARV